MFDNYSKEEVDIALNRLEEDLKIQSPVSRRPALIFAALDAISSHGSDWQEIEKILRNRNIRPGGCPRREM